MSSFSQKSAGKINARHSWRGGISLRQHRKLGLLSILFVSLVGCGNGDKTTVQDQATGDTTPMGYYSNENHKNNGGNAVLLDGADNDGPVTEIMDHSFGAERNTNQRFLRVNNKNDNNQANNISPMNNANPNPIENGYQDNLNSRDPLIGGSDQNYHGQINNSNHATRQSYYNGNSGKLSGKITKVVGDVDNVKDAETVIYENNVIVGVQLNNAKLEGETKRKIQQAIQSQVKGRRIQVITNPSQYNRLKTINNDLRNGGPRGEINKDIKNLIQTNDDNR
jgi:spore cortex protein